MPVSVLKEVKAQVTGPLCHIINMSFSTGVFPRRLKSAYIKAIYKKGEIDEEKMLQTLLPSFIKYW